MQKIEFSCQRGQYTIRGYEYKTEMNNGIPVIISHEFLGNQNHVKRYAEGLAEAGYVVFTFDFCGGGLMSKSDGKLSDMSIDTEKLDLKAVIDYVVNLNYVMGEKLILMGESQGGFVSCLVASEYGDKINKVILLYPALCIPDDAQRGKMLFMRFDPNNIDGTLKCILFKFSPAYPKSAKNINIYDEIQNISADILIIHGDKDKIVNVSYAERASTVTENCRVEILKGAGHGFNKKEARSAISLITDYLKI